MGWASGSELAESVWKLVRRDLPLAKRKRAAKELIRLFEGYDCDTIDEAQTLCVDAGRDPEEDEGYE